MSTAWMFRRDPSRHVRETVARQAGELMQRFCSNADRHMMRSREEAFLVALDNWVNYALAGNKSKSTCMKELERLIRPAKVMPSRELSPP